jgi:8-oxo-dGTP diphosphatase
MSTTAISAVIPTQTIDRPSPIVVTLMPEIERDAARLLIRAPTGRVLMLHLSPPFRDPFWVTPGGGLDRDETMLDAAKRELYEEVGRDDLPIGPCVEKRDSEFEWEDWHVRQHQWTFLVEAPDEFESRVLHPDEEPIIGSAWFSAEELRALSEDVYPEGLTDLLVELQRS